MKRNEKIFWFVAILYLVVMVIQCNKPALAQRITLQKPFGTIIYDDSLKCPIDVSYFLNAGSRSSSIRRGKWAFKADPALPKPRATSSDYTNSGYQRGHMCPAADMASSRVLMKSTFIMSNVAPQAPSLNMGEWKRIENEHRKISAIYDGCSVRVGALFLDDSYPIIGRHGIAVPSHFIRILWKAGSSFPTHISIVENR